MSPENTATITDSSSMGDIRAMLAGEAAPAVAEPQAAEPTADAVVEPETAPAPVETKQVAETEEDIPEGVKKRIAKEVEREAKYQRKIDEAVSARKAKEAELAKLSTDAPGSQPDTKAQASNERPKRPQFGEAGHEQETYDQFEARQAGHEEKLADWVKAEALREFKTATAAEQAQAKAQERWDAAVKEHGAEFPELMEKAQAIAPEGLQQAISSLDNWSKVAVHLAKNEAQLKELAATYTANPYRAIATLGRIEASLTAAAPKTATSKPLPEPLAKVGGNASVSGETLQNVLENGSMSQFKAAVKRARG